MAGHPAAAVPDVDVLDASTPSEVPLKVLRCGLGVKLSRHQRDSDVYVRDAYVTNVHPRFRDGFKVWDRRRCHRFRRRREHRQCFDLGLFLFGGDGGPEQLLPNGLSIGGFLWLSQLREGNLVSPDGW
jgi:hypothetical protein